MLDFCDYHPSVKVLLNPGIYVFTPKSATGKTYLYYALRDIRKFERVDAYSYDDGRPLSSVLSNENCDLLLLDRFDMYQDKCEDGIREFANHGVVLLDCKSSRPKLHVSMCNIELNESGVIIS